MTRATPLFGAGGQVVQRALRAREVDQHLARGQGRVQVGADRHARGAAEERARVLPERGAVRRRRSRRTGAVGSVEHGFDQHAAHGVRRRRAMAMRSGAAAAALVSGDVPLLMARSKRGADRPASRPRPRRTMRFPPPRPASQGGALGRRQLELGRRGGQLAAADGRDELVLARQRRGVDLLHRVVVERDHEGALQVFEALALEREHVVPALGMERIR